MATTKQFTLADALAIQRKDIDKYKTIITAEAFSELCKHADKKNEGVTEPYNIFRGQDVYIWLENYATQIANPCW